MPHLFFHYFFIDTSCSNLNVIRPGHLGKIPERDPAFCQPAICRKHRLAHSVETLPAARLRLTGFW